jgi:hypothetical protein
MVFKPGQSGHPAGRKRKRQSRLTMAHLKTPKDIDGLTHSRAEETLRHRRSPSDRVADPIQFPQLCPLQGTSMSSAMSAIRLRNGLVVLTMSFVARDTILRRGRIEIPFVGIRAIVQERRQAAPCRDSERRVWHGPRTCLASRWQLSAPPLASACYPGINRQNIATAYSTLMVRRMQ